MFKCGLGCGLVVHDIDEHIASFHAGHEAVLEHLPTPVSQPAQMWDYSGWEAYETYLSIRQQFIQDYFREVRL